MDATSGLRTRYRRDREESRTRNEEADKQEKSLNGKTSSFEQILPEVSPAAVATTILSPGLIMTMVLIFGGCCSNVYTLEAILKLSPDTGTLVTFLQFLLISLYSLRSQLASKSPGNIPSSIGYSRLIFRLKQRLVPLHRWLMYTILFLSINMLNNMAFKYRISVPLHIILRSAGPVTSMLVGWIVAGKRYSPRQIVAVTFLFAGVMLAAVSDAKMKSQPRPVSNAAVSSMDDQSSSMGRITILEQAPGFMLLFSALLLSAVMGLYSDRLFDTYGRSTEATDESLFYSHALSLPFFALQTRTLRDQYDALRASSFVDSTPKTGICSTSLTSTSLSRIILNNLPHYLQQLLLKIRDESLGQTMLLLTNAATQIVCITGVSRLSTQTSSLTVSVVLNIRKLVSLLLSIWLFGNQLPLGVAFGAVLVFIGGGLYGWRSKSKPATTAHGKTQNKKDK